MASTTYTNKLIVMGADGFPINTQQGTGATDGDTIELTGAVSKFKAANLEASQDVTVGGNLTIQGDVYSKHAEHMVIGDNFLELNSGNVATANASGGFSIVTAMIDASQKNVNAAGFTAGNAGNSNPKIRLAAGDVNTYNGNDIIQVVGSTSNDGLYLVQAKDTTNGSEGLFLYGIGNNAVPADTPFLQNQLVTEAGGSAKISKVKLSVLATADGNLKDDSGQAIPVGELVFCYAATGTGATKADFDGSNGKGWDQIAKSAGGTTMQQAYDAGSVVNLTNAKGNVTFNMNTSGNAGFTVEGTSDAGAVVFGSAGSNKKIGSFAMDSAGTITIQGGGTVAVDGGANALNLGSTVTGTGAINIGDIASAKTITFGDSTAYNAGSANTATTEVKVFAKRMTFDLNDNAAVASTVAFIGRNANAGGTGNFHVDMDGGISLDAGASSNFSTTATAANALTLSSGGGIEVTMGATGTMKMDGAGLVLDKAGAQSIEKDGAATHNLTLYQKATNGGANNAKLILQGDGNAAGAVSIFAPTSNGTVDIWAGATANTGTANGTINIDGIVNINAENGTPQAVSIVAAALSLDGSTVGLGTDSGSGAVTIGGGNAAGVAIDAKAASLWKVTGANLDIQTVTSGTLALTSAGALGVTAVASSTWHLNAAAAGAQTLTIAAQNSGGNASIDIDAKTAIDMDAPTMNLAAANASTTVNIGGAGGATAINIGNAAAHANNITIDGGDGFFKVFGKAASEIKTNGANLTIEALGTGDLILSSAASASLISADQAGEFTQIGNASKFVQFVQGGLTDSGMASYAFAPSGVFNVTAGDSSLIQMNVNVASDKTLSLKASNGNAGGKGILALDGDDVKIADLATSTAVFIGNAASATAVTIGGAGQANTININSGSSTATLEGAGAVSVKSTGGNASFESAASAQAKFGLVGSANLQMATSSGDTTLSANSLAKIDVITSKGTSFQGGAASAFKCNGDLGNGNDVLGVEIRSQNTNASGTSRIEIVSDGRLDIDAGTSGVSIAGANNANPVKIATLGGSPVEIGAAANPAGQIAAVSGANSSISVVGDITANANNTKELLLESFDNGTGNTFQSKVRLHTNLELESKADISIKATANVAVKSDIAITQDNGGFQIQKAFPMPMYNQINVAANTAAGTICSLSTGSWAATDATGGASNCPMGVNKVTVGGSAAAQPVITQHGLIVGVLFGDATSNNAARGSDKPSAVGQAVYLTKDGRATVANADIKKSNSYEEMWLLGHVISTVAQSGDIFNILWCPRLLTKLT